jgi:hypothetical protein
MSRRRARARSGCVEAHQPVRGTLYTSLSSSFLSGATWHQRTPNGFLPFYFLAVTGRPSPVDALEQSLLGSLEGCHAALDVVLEPLNYRNALERVHHLCISRQGEAGV